MSTRQDQILNKAFLKTKCAVLQKNEVLISRIPEVFANYVSNKIVPTHHSGVIYHLLK